MAASPADSVLTNDQFYTVDESNSWVEALAVTGSDIIYVGDLTRSPIPR